MADIALIPFPRQKTLRTGTFHLLPQGRLIANSSDAAEAAGLLAEYLRPATGFSFPMASGVPRPGDIFLEERGNNTVDEDGFGDESYRVSVTSETVALNAENHAGLCRAIQTLRQLFPPEIYGETIVAGGAWEIPAVEIEDGPEYRWRGLHLDVGRHFFTEAEVCRFIELAAQHKFNRFHWHLTDDQGWRIEIKRYPKLTEIGAHRAETMVGHDGHDNHRPCHYDGIPYGGFYTQESIRRVIAFAARRGLAIVPEIDMPGHVQAAVASYPELGNFPDRPVKVWPQWGASTCVLNMEPATLEFMKNVLSEVMNLFPSKYIHIGGDEVQHQEWTDNPRIKQCMHDLECPSFDGLQGNFMAQIADFLRRHGRFLIGWHDIIKCGVPKDAAVMTYGCAFQEMGGFKMINVDCSRTYLDHYQGDPRLEPLAFGDWLPLDAAYDFHPAPHTLRPELRSLVLGGQGQVWTEYIPDFRHVEYMTWPRACALAERLWCEDAECCYGDFLHRLSFHLRRLDASTVNYRPWNKDRNIRQGKTSC